MKLLLKGSYRSSYILSLKKTRKTEFICRNVVLIGIVVLNNFEIQYKTEASLIVEAEFPDVEKV